MAAKAAIGIILAFMAAKAAIGELFTVPGVENSWKRILLVVKGNIVRSPADNAHTNNATYCPALILIRTL